MTILKVKNAKTKKIKWKSSNKKVASIKKAGSYGVKITARKAGRAKITCKTAGKKLTCKVIVKDKRKTDNKTDNDNIKKDETPKCEHEWAEKWATFELEGDYPADVTVCYCGILEPGTDLKRHLFETSVASAAYSKTKMEMETGIHGTKARGTSSVDVYGDISAHVTIKREYIEYYYCTKCGKKVGIAWDKPKTES